MGGLPLFPLRGVRVLVVDDNQASREHFEQALEGSGALVTAVDTAREALERVGTVDVVVTEISMPRQRA